MQLALYCPVYGYYEGEAEKIGKRGDFYTSVSIGSVFGELLAFQFARWLSELAADASEMTLVEAGAHTGQLSRDILTWLRRNRSDVFERVNYCIAEPSMRRRQWQEKKLHEFGGRVRWVHDLSDLSRAGGVVGIIFSNELLDAMPVHRFGWDAAAHAWFEWGVAVEGGSLKWKRMPLESGANARPPAVSRGLLERLPDGFIVEASPAAEAWWSQAAGCLRRGKLLTIDYGLQIQEFFMPHRVAGTLRSYSAHRLDSNILADPGYRDITAHVNFTAIQSAGERAGLITELFASQESFFVGVAREAEKHNGGFEWTQGRARQLQTLVHPEHLGRRFQVLIQKR
jgi:SAM-dependent MidA family methyltransferase